MSISVDYNQTTFVKLCISSDTFIKFMNNIAINLCYNNTLKKNERNKIELHTWTKHGNLVAQIKKRVEARSSWFARGGDTGWFTCHSVRYGWLNTKAFFQSFCHRAQSKEVKNGISVVSDLRRTLQCIRLYMRTAPFRSHPRNRSLRFCKAGLTGKLKYC